MKHILSKLKQISALELNDRASLEKQERKQHRVILLLLALIFAALISSVLILDLTSFA